MRMHEAPAILIAALAAWSCGGKGSGPEDAAGEDADEEEEAQDVEEDDGDAPDAPGPSIRITSPVGGEVWRGREDHEIRWTSTGSIETVDISLTLDDGSFWHEMAAGEANDGVYEWTIAEWIDSGLCRVRIMDTAGTAGDQSGLFSIRPAGEWTTETIGTIPHSTTENGMEIAVGDGRDDGTNRVYVASWEGDLVELTYDTAGWVSEMVLDGARTLVPVVVGDARDDGTSLVVTGSAYTGADEVMGFEWTGAWSSEVVDDALIQVMSVRIAEGRNDGVNRLYAGAEGGGGLVEYTWDGAGWLRTVVSATVSASAFSVEDGRNDGILRIYCPDRATGRGLHEYTWNGAGWEDEIIDLVPDRLSLAVVGPGRSDGTNRVYAAGFDDHLYELTWNGEGWDVLDVTPEGPESSRFSGSIADVRGDGIVRLYVTTEGGPPVTEIEWHEDHYMVTEVDAITSATAGALTTGDGRGDGTERLYVTDHATGDVYEITWTPL